MGTTTSKQTNTAAEELSPNSMKSGPTPSSGVDEVLSPRHEQGTLPIQQKQQDQVEGEEDDNNKSKSAISRKRSIRAVSEDQNIRTEEITADSLKRIRSHRLMSMDNTDDSDGVSEDECSSEMSDHRFRIVSQDPFTVRIKTEEGIPFIHQTTNDSRQATITASQFAAIPPDSLLTGRLIDTPYGLAVLLPPQTTAVEYNAALAARNMNPSITPAHSKNKRWTKAEDKLLAYAVEQEGGRPPHNWKEIARTYFPGMRSDNQVCTCITVVSRATIMTFFLLHF